MRPGPVAAGALGLALAAILVAGWREEAAPEAPPEPGTAAEPQAGPLLAAGPAVPGASADPADARAAVGGVFAGDPEARRRLLAIAERDPGVLRDLVEALRERYDGERWRAGTPHAGLHLPVIAAALRALGEPAVEALAAALRDDDDSLRIRSAWALGEIGPAAATAAPALAANARDRAESAYVRAAALEAAGRLGSAAADLGPDALAWVRREDAPEPLAAAAAGALLRLLGPVEEALAGARLVLERQALEPCVRLLAALEEVPVEGAPLIPALLELLGSVQQDGPLEREALATLGRIAADDPRATDVLLAVLANEDRRDSVRAHAARVLARGGAGGRESLVRHAEGAGPPVRLLAFAALVEDPDTERDPRVHALLAPLLSDPEDPVRREALSWLAPRTRGALLGEVVRAIGPLARSADESDRSVATWLLAAMAEPRADAAALAIVLCGDDEPWIRTGATEALRVHRSAAGDEGFEALVAGTRDPVQAVRCTAVEAVADAATERPAEVRAALVAALGDPDPGVVTGAASRLADLGPSAREALPALESARDRLPDGAARRAVEGAIRAVSRTP